MPSLPSTAALSGRGPDPHKSRGRHASSGHGFREKGLCGYVGAKLGPVCVGLVDSCDDRLPEILPRHLISRPVRRVSWKAVPLWGRPYRVTGRMAGHCSHAGGLFASLRLFPGPGGKVPFALARRNRGENIVRNVRTLAVCRIDPKGPICIRQKFPPTVFRIALQVATRKLSRGIGGFGRIRIEGSRQRGLALLPPRPR